MTRYTVDLDDDQVDEVRTLLPAGALRKKPAPRRRETEDYVTTVRRMLAGLARRAEGDVTELGRLAELREALDDVVQAHIKAAREIGASWAEIGRELGTTKQGAQQRYGGTERADRKPRQPVVDGQTAIEDHL